jgi:hypothetical protein
MTSCQAGTVLSNHADRVASFTASSNPTRKRKASRRRGRERVFSSVIPWAGRLSFDRLERLLLRRQAASSKYWCCQQVCALASACANLATFHLPSILVSVAEMWTPLYSNRPWEPQVANGQTCSPSRLNSGSQALSLKLVVQPETRR